MQYFFVATNILHSLISDTFITCICRDIPPLDPPTRLRENIVSPIEKGAKPVLDCGLDAYNVRPFESEIVLKDMLSFFWFSASSNATVNAV